MNLTSIEFSKTVNNEHVYVHSLPSALSLESICVSWYSDKYEGCELIQEVVLTCYRDVQGFVVQVGALS